MERDTGMTGLPLVRAKRRSEHLELGDQYRLHPDCGDPRTYEVMRVGPSSLSVRATAGSDREHVEFETYEGKQVDFARPGRRFQICRRPLGIIRCRAGNLGDEVTAAIGQGLADAVAALEEA